MDAEVGNLKSENQVLRAQLESAVLLVDLLVDKRACEFDRHYGCLVHHFESPCPHELAKRFVEEFRRDGRDGRDGVRLGGQVVKGAEVSP